jgi:hypothetical protein
MIVTAPIVMGARFKVKSQARPPNSGSVWIRNVPGASVDLIIGTALDPGAAGALARSSLEEKPGAMITPRY